MSQYYYDPFGNSSVMGESVRVAERKADLKHKKKAEKKQIRIISFTMSLAMLTYLGIQLVFGEVIRGTKYYDLYLNDSLFQSATTIVFVSLLAVLVPFAVMGLINKKKYEYPVIPNNAISAKKSFQWISFGMLCCVVANVLCAIIITFFNNLFDINMESSELLDPDSVLACVMEIVALAIVPAICEELAMRCFSMQLLRKFGKGFSVFAVSIVFGLMHANVPQFLFGFTIGLILGYVTIKTGSIVPALFIHGFNNGISAITSTVIYACGKKYENYVVAAFYVFWLAVGVISTITLFAKGDFKKAPKEDSCVLSNGEKFSAFLFPWMLLPLGILVYITAFTIKAGA